MDTIKILRGAEPFYYPGNNVGCLVVHGFTGAPQEVRWLGQYLNKQGYTVYGPRLAGHGSTPQDMARATWREWYSDVLAGYLLLRERCKWVFALGLSMGGSLSLLLASREAVDGVVSMSAPNHIPVGGPMLLAAAAAALFGAMMPKRRLSPEEDEFLRRVLAEQRARGEDPIGHVSYPVNPTRPAMQLGALLKAMQAGLPDISAPALLMQSRRDEVVPFEHLQRNFDSMGSRDKQMIVLENSLHVITEDRERDVVFEAAADFIAAHCGDAQAAPGRKRRKEAK